MKLESTRIVDIEKFVPRETIDRLYWDTPYHLVPTGKTGIEAFAVIREAMKRKGMVAIGRLVMSTRERVCAIEIEEDGLVLTTLRTAEEVRTLDEIGHPDLPKPNAQMLDIAEKIVAQQTGRLRSGGVHRSLRGRAARTDRGEEEGPAGQGHEGAGAGRHECHRPHGCPEEEPAGEGPLERRKSTSARTKRAANTESPQGTGSMSVQLPLPAGWARNFVSMPDPRDRLDALLRDRDDAKAQIRLILDRLADKYDVPALGR